MAEPVDTNHTLRELIANEKRLRALVTASSDVIYSLSADWEVMHELDGRGFLKDTHGPMTGWRFQNVYAGDMEMVNIAIDEAIRNKKIFELEHRVNRADGTTGWTISRAVPILDDEGNITEWFGTASDITDRKLAEEKLAEINAKVALAEESLRIATESGELGTWYYEIGTGRFETSERFNEMFGLPLNVPSTYEQALTLVREDHRDRVNDAVNASFNNGTSFNVEYAIGGVGKKERWVRSVGKLVTNENGLTYITGVLADITEQKMDEARKNDFIGMVSHELKTPLTSLTAIIQVADNKLRLSEDHFLASAMKKASAQVRRMSSMINGFLNISRLESGKIDINKQKFHLHELIAETVAEFEITTASHIIEINDCDDVTINADRDKIASVLSNLIGNAVKYSPAQAEVTVKCKMTGTEVIVSVADKGMGIAAGDLERIFDRYYRAESSKTQHISGFGIGLYLSAEIIQRHNGRIWADSEPGKGSTFYFSLPLQ